MEQKTSNLDVNAIYVCREGNGFTTALFEGAQASRKNVLRNVCAYHVVFVSSNALLLGNMMAIKIYMVKFYSCQIIE